MNTLKPIRILVCDMPRMLRDIIEDAISRQADMQLIDDGGETNCADAVRRSVPDVVIVAQEAAPGAVSREQLLVDHPQLKMFVVAHDGREAHLLEFRRMPVVQVSPQRLVDAIRAAIESGNGPPNSGLVRPRPAAGPGGR